MANDHYELGYQFGKTHAACEPEEPVYTDRYLKDLETHFATNMSSIIRLALEHELEYVRGYLVGYRWRYPSYTPPDGSGRIL